MAELKKDLAQSLRGKPSTAFYSSSSGHAVLRYVSDTVPIPAGGDCAPFEAEVQAVIFNGIPAHNSSVILRTESGDSLRIGFRSGSSPFNGFPDSHDGESTIVDVTDLSPSDALKALEAKLRSFSFLKPFEKADKLIILDVNLNPVTWSDDSLFDFSTEVARLIHPAMPEGYRRGDYYRHCPHLRVIDAWIEGSDDTHHNVTLLLKADLRRLSELSDNVNFPDDFAQDGYSVDYPYFGDSEEITWEFEVSEVGGYERAPSGTPHPTFPNAVLISERMSVSGGSGRVTRIYRHVGPLSEQIKSGYSVSYEDVGTDAQREVSERFPIVTLTTDVELYNYKPVVCGSRCPIVGATGTTDNPSELDFGNLFLIEPPQMETQNTIYGRMTAVYGRLPGYRFISTSEHDRWGTLTQVRQRVAPTTTAPTRGDRGPDPGTRIINVSWDRRNSCSADLLISYATVPSCLQAGTVFNSQTGELDPYSSRIVHNDDVQDEISRLSAEGFFTTSQPLDCEFSTITTRQAKPFDSRSYFTTQNFHWPAVLSGVEMMDWLRVSGGHDLYPRAVFKRVPYSGPCRALVFEAWSHEQHAVPSIEVMQPTPVTYSCPAFSFNSGPCLHDLVQLRCDFGNNHSVYALNVGSERPPRGEDGAVTNYLDWPASLLVSARQTSHQGGWLLRTVTVFPPDL